MKQTKPTTLMKTFKELDQERYTNFVHLLQECLLKNSISDCVDFAILKKFLEEDEKKNPFTISEIEDFMDKMECENLILRRGDNLFLSGLADRK